MHVHHGFHSVAVPLTQVQPIARLSFKQEKSQLGVGARLVRGMQWEQQCIWVLSPHPEALAAAAASPCPPPPAHSTGGSLSCQAPLLSAASGAPGCQRQDFISGSLRPYRKPQMFICVSYCLAKSAGLKNIREF